MTLKLIIDGQEKLFVMGSFIPARLVREAIQAQMKLQTEDVVVEDLDVVIDIVRRAFNKQFTIDQFYDGLDSRELYKTLGSVINFLITGETNTH